MASPKAAALLLVLFAAVTAPLRVQGTAYRITPSGAQGGAAPNDYGVGSGFGNEESSSWQWLRYLNPTSVRLFVQPLTNNWNWIKFVGNQYGLSFKQVPVVDQASWQAAVEQERSISDAPDKPNYFTWLQDNSPIKWSQILTNLNTTQTGAYGAQRGNPQYVLLQLQRRGYAVSSLWDVRCTNLDLATDNPDDAEYWKRRWEMYRLFYFGGWWMAQEGADFLELYNEPDKNSCEPVAYWIDDVRIRSQAFQDAYADYAKWSGKQQKLSIAAPPLASAWAGNFSSTIVTYMHTPFPGDQVDENFVLADQYSYHKYGSFTTGCTSAEFSAECHNANGYGAYSSFLTVQSNVAKLSDQQLPVYISEMNCYTNAQSNSKSPYFDQVHTFDQAQTAACVGAMITSLINKPSTANAFSIFKFVQTLNSDKTIVKNGLFYGGTERPPYDISGSTKSGEVYRLILRKTPPTRRNSVWDLKITPTYTKSLLTSYIVDDNQAYYIYVNNEQWLDHTITINLAALPGLSLGSAPLTGTVVTSAVTTDYQGGVSDMYPLPSTLLLTLATPPGSFFMLTVPKVPTAQATVAAKAAVSIQAGANANTNYASSPLMPVATSQTSADGVAVALIQFPDTDAVASRDAIVTAVLQVYLGGIDGAPLSHDQVLTLVSNPYSWDLQTVTWNTMPLVKAPPADGVKTTTDNFIKFGVNTADPDAMPMGMPVVPVVLPDGGMYLRVDVTEYIKRSKTLNYAIVRMFRYDASTAGPGDDPQGVYNFGSGAVGDAAKVPSLLLDYQTG